MLSRLVLDLVELCANVRNVRSTDSVSLMSTVGNVAV